MASANGDEPAPLSGSVESVQGAAPGRTSAGRSRACLSARRLFPDERRPLGTPLYRAVSRLLFPFSACASSAGRSLPHPAGRCNSGRATRGSGAVDAAGSARNGFVPSKRAVGSSTGLLARPGRKQVNARKKRQGGAAGGQIPGPGVSAVLTKRTHWRARAGHRSGPTAAQSPSLIRTPTKPSLLPSFCPRALENRLLSAPDMVSSDQRKEVVWICYLTWRWLSPDSGAVPSLHLVRPLGDSHLA